MNKVTHLDMTVENTFLVINDECRHIPYYRVVTALMGIDINTTS